MKAQGMEHDGLNNNAQNANTSCFPFFKQSGKAFLSYLLFLFSLLPTYAQQYPVQVNQNLVPPYNTKLSTYATASDTKLNLQLLLTDINENNRQVRLRLYIQGNGLNVRSAPVVIGAPDIFLDGGVPQFFTNVDLQAYFELNNLTGIDPQQYGRSLPDGVYRICWEVYDHITNLPLSQKSCIPVYLLLNDPPVLNVPQRGESVSQRDPVNIIFQWTPRHVNATNVSYEFELREIWDNYMDPQAAFLASPNYYSETTYGTTLLYDMGKPVLLPGKRYAWRVRAVSTSGISENSVFKNNGRSEIYHFTYGSDCPQPLYALSEALSPTRVKLTWQGRPEHNRYHLQYRKAGVNGAEWFGVSTYNAQVQLSNLEAGAAYDFRVGGTCNQITDLEPSYTYGNINRFTMPTKEEAITYNCGVMPEIDIDNTDPLANIGVNETFMAGDFPVTIKQIQGGNGTFSGTGYIVVPYLADTRIAVEFTGIRINTDHQLFDGVIETTYDPNWGGVSDIGNVLGGGPGSGQEVTVNFQIGSPDDIQVDPNGDILIIGPSGEIMELPGGQDYVITDGSSPPKQYAVDEDGKVTQLGTVADGGKPTSENTNGVNSDGEATDITAKGVLVTFAKASDNKYGFDAYNTAYPNTQDLYEKMGGDYYIPYKAVKNGDEDHILAHIAITDNSIVVDSLVFKTQDGSALEVVERNGDQWKLKVRGYQKDAVKEVLATIKQGDKYQVAGAFKLYHLEEKEINVVLVNTNNVNKQAIEDKLNEVYKQAVVKVNIVREITDFDIDALDGAIQSGESGFAANYTQQQRDINRQLRNRQDYSPNAYYLITTDLTPSTSGEQGLMPLGRQFGYVYGNNAHTVTHELAHGAFKLKHPFSEHSYGWTPESTDWLMDYAGGDHLPYVHWQEIHNPNLRIGLFDRDNEGESSFDPADPLARIIAALADSGDLGLIKCKKCDDGTEMQALDGYHRLTLFGQNYACLVATIRNNDIEKLLAQNNLPTSAPSDIAPYYSLIREEIAGKDNALYLFDQLGELTECTVKYPLPDTFCSEPDFDAPGVKEQLIEEIEQCVDGVLGRIREKLLALKANFRDNQQAQFIHNGNVYRLNANDEVEVVDNALTDAQIERGEWRDENIDQVFRVFENGNGILQFKAVGIRSNLSMVEGKTADLQSLSQNMKDKGNAFLVEFQVKDLNDTPQEKEAKLDSDAFADGKKIEIKEDVSFFKIISEGAGKMGTLLKTGTIEESTYLESTELTEVVHAPGLVTGSMEAATRAVTDITGVVVLVYDMSVDGKARQGTLDGLAKVKDQIMEEPSTLFPLLTDIALEELTGNNKEAWEQSLNGATDTGKRGHVITKGSVRTAITVFTSGKLITALPKMADELAAKLLDAKLWEKFKKAEGFTESMLQGFKKNLNELLEKIPEAAESLSKIADYSSARELADLVAKMNKLKEVPGLNKVIADMAQQWTKFKGGQFVLDYFSSKIDNLGGNLRFEVPTTLTIDGKDVARIYDGFLEKAGSAIKYELKNWSGWYPSTIKTQFIRDIQGIGKLDELKWVFNSTAGVNSGKLKTKILETLKKADGSPIDELKAISESQIKKLFPEDIRFIDNNNRIEFLLDKLEDNNVFDKIFEVVE